VSRKFTLKEHLERSKLAIILIFLMCFSISVLSGCISLYGRRTFAQKALEGAHPILKEYRIYIDKDPNLGADDKRIRLRTAEEFENFLKEGSK